MCTVSWTSLDNVSSNLDRFSINFRGHPPPGPPRDGKKRTGGTRAVPDEVFHRFLVDFGVPGGPHYRKFWIICATVSATLAICATFSATFAHRFFEATFCVFFGAGGVEKLSLSGVADVAKV